MSTTTSVATTPTATAPALTDAAPADPAGAEEIGEARRRIDALDEQIIALVRERMTVSAGIQRARVAAGGRRVQLTREMEILARYRDELGRPGTAMAMTVLELSRGRA